MKMKRKKRVFCAVGFLVAFLLWTAAVRLVDVRSIGPQGSSVGLAGINEFVHRLTGVHFTLYNMTDWLGLVPIGICMGFGLLGLAQWIKRRSLFKVDFDLFVLGGFYLVTIGTFLFFEHFAVNFRPVLIQGLLEASYPSSTTLLTMCVMPTAILQWNRRIKNKTIRKSVLVVSMAFTAFMVAGRLISGVHWFTDIIGGALLSAGLVMLYSFITD